MSRTYFTWIISALFNPSSIFFCTIEACRKERECRNQFRIRGGLRAPVWRPFGSVCFFFSTGAPAQTGTARSVWAHHLLDGIIHVEHITQQSFPSRPIRTAKARDRPNLTSHSLSSSIANFTGTNDAIKPSSPYSRSRLFLHATSSGLSCPLPFGLHRNLSQGYGRWMRSKVYIKSIVLYSFIPHDLIRFSRSLLFMFTGMMTICYRLMECTTKIYFTTIKKFFPVFVGSTSIYPPHLLLHSEYAYHLHHFKLHQ